MIGYAPCGDHMFLAGEFSTIARISKRSLQFYDEIGLFKPAHIDQSNGYRYYSAAQLPELNRILALKDLGLTLEQIKAMVQSEISDEEIHGMWLIKKAEMEQSIAEDMQRLRHIEARLDQNRDSDLMTVVIKSIPEQWFLAVRQLFASEEELFALVGQMMSVIPEAVSGKWLGPMIGVFRDDSFLTTHNDIELGYILKKDISRTVDINPLKVARVQTLPAVETMATVVQSGSSEVDFMGFGKLATWIEENSYQIAGPYREIVFDAQNPSEIANGTIEIQIPVRRKQDANR